MSDELSRLRGKEVAALSKMQADPVSTAAPFDLAAVMEEAVELMAAPAQEQGLDIIVAPAPELTRLVVGDPLRTRQVLVNRIVNAIKFATAGEVFLTCDVSPVHADRIVATLSVHASGLGFAPELITLSFDLAGERPADTLPTRHPVVFITRSAALGEAVQRQCRLLGVSGCWLRPTTPRFGASLLAEGGKDLLLVDAQHCEEEAQGMIEACADPRVAMRCIFVGTPATFDKLQLPAGAPLARIVQKPLTMRSLRKVLSDAGRKIAALAERSRDDLGRLHGRILIVEDNPVNAEVFDGMLRELGCSRATATGGREAVRMAAAGSYDAILMDVYMPDIDGWAATDLIRRAETGRPRKPIIALTADAAGSHRQRCIDAGMDDFLSKPVSFEELHAALAHWLPSTAGAHVTTGTISVTSIIQMRQIERMSGGGFLNRVTQVFIDSSERQVQAILAALPRADLPAICKLCHSLKSGAAHVGADEFAQLAIDTERAAKAGDIERVISLAGLLKAARDAAAAALRAELGGRGA
jgi:CheY-like chemotaxis protein/HPt (histidine-containing phosphotransfer) domain-containing protein